MSKFLLTFSLILGMTQAAVNVSNTCVRLSTSVRVKAVKEVTCFPEFMLGPSYNEGSDDWSYSNLKDWTPEDLCVDGQHQSPLNMPRNSEHIKESLDDINDPKSVDFLQELRRSDLVQSSSTDTHHGLIS